MIPEPMIQMPDDERFYILETLKQIKVLVMLLEGRFKTVEDVEKEALRKPEQEMM